MLNFILLIALFLLQLFTIIFFSDSLPLFIIILNMVFIIICFSLNLYQIKNKKKIKSLTLSLEEAQLYNESLKTLHDDVRTFKHDFSNILQAIGGYISFNDLNGLRDYYNSLVKDFQKVNNLYVLSPDVINEPAIHNLFSKKYYIANELGINMNINIFLDFRSLDVNVYEFSRILGILLDNAIESANECDEKIINIDIRKDLKVNRKLFIIENTYVDKNLNINRIFEKGYSSKSNNSGLGLWEVHKILKKNKNLNLHTTKTDTFFRQQLEIYPYKNAKKKEEEIFN